MYEDSDYGQEAQNWKSSPLHQSHKPPHPDSLVDLNYNRRSQEENAMVAIGKGLNSLGKPLALSRKKLHIIPALEKWKVRYVIKLF